MNKICTSKEQSNKLIELGIDRNTADMYYDVNNYGIQSKPEVAVGEVWSKDIPAWSLAALLDVLPKEVEIEGQRYAPCLFPVQNKWLLKLWYNSNYTITSPIAIFSDNPINACYEMILKLHEQKLL